MTIKNGHARDFRTGHCQQDKEYSRAKSAHVVQVTEGHRFVTCQHAEQRVFSSHIRSENVVHVTPERRLGIRQEGK
jgi:hypothetical protein